MTVALRHGLNDARGARMPHTEFRTSFTHPEGLGKTDIFSARVVNVDLVNWTVDVVSQFDQMRLFGIQVGSPYMHYSRGEGMGAVPEIGAKCEVCWPGDSSPPFVLAFIMPHETISISGSEEAPTGTRERAASSQLSSNASFAGGRERGKPGDIFMRGRDGNFLVLHRGGVLQIGSTELAQRVYVPLSNLIMDFAENYELHNAGGGVRWGIQDGEGETNLPAEFSQMFRVYANDKFADVRVAIGRVHSPVAETDQDAITDQGVLEVAKTEPVVYELALARGGFNADSGAPQVSAGGAVRLRVIFDRAGNFFTRLDGNAGFLCKKKLRIRAKQAMEIFADDTFALTAKNGARVSVDGTLEFAAKVTKFGTGTAGVARAGDNVQFTLPPNLLAVAPTPAGFAPISTLPGFSSVTGVITSASSELLVTGPFG